MTAATPSFPWSALPPELRTLILSHVPLDELLHSTQSVFPHDAPALVDMRIRALRPLWRAWLNSPIAVRNLPAYRTRLARYTCTPAEFVRLPRLVLGASCLAGTLTSAIAELGPHLKVLHLDDNDLTGLPDQLKLCTNLLLLDCSANAFRQVPPVVMRLQELQYVTFGQNREIRSIPPQIAAMQHVKALSFSRCALRDIPFQVIEKAIDTTDFSLDVSGNCFPRKYIVRVCEQFPVFKRKLTHVMVE